MVDYITTNANGEFVLYGDTVIGAQGDTGTFEDVVGQDPEGGGMLILVDGRAEYAGYWGVSVEEIEDEEYYDGWAEAWVDRNEDSGFGDFEDDYTGYDVRDEYYEDLYGEAYC